MPVWSQTWPARAGGVVEMLHTSYKEMSLHPSLGARGNEFFKFVTGGLATLRLGAGGPLRRLHCTVWPA
jgi:hypothetical protein